MAKLLKNPNTTEQARAANAKQNTLILEISPPNELALVEENLLISKGNESYVAGSNETSYNQNVLRTVQSILANKALLTAILGALGYFYGWRFLVSYYGGFGIDPMFYSFSPIETVAAGWRTFMFTAVLLILANYSTILIGRTVQRLIRRVGIKPIFGIFFLCLAMSLILVFRVVYLFYYVWGAHSTFGFYVWTFLCLTIMWITYIIGNSIFVATSIELPKTDHLTRFFRITFPSPTVWLASISIGFVFATAFLSSYNGLVYSKRDQGRLSRLQIATFYVNRRLQIPEGELVRKDVWRYDDLRNVYKTDEFYFAFRPDEIKDNILNLYAFPKENVVEIKFRGWFSTIDTLPAQKP